MYNFVEVSWHNLGEFSDLRFPFTLRTNFKPLLLGGRVKSKIEVTVNSKQENLKTLVLIRSKNPASAENGNILINLRDHKIDPLLKSCYVTDASNIQLMPIRF
jgi:hypothetical protein